MDEISLARVDDLRDWSWTHGKERKGRYALPTGSWLRELYDVSEKQLNLQEANTATKPSVAIWGPSQTGKSTSVSSYIDQNAIYTGDVSTDGEGSGLHWPGGKPAYFIHPSLTKGAPGNVPSTVLNPFNSGLDASACLSRFTAGSRGDEGDRKKVHDPDYPIQIQLVRAYELWMSVARGYTSQCWGPVPDPPTDAHGRPAPRYQTVWSNDNFMATFRAHRDRLVEPDQPLSRVAYERLHTFTRLVDDMIFAGLPRYRQLSSGELGWTKISEQILSEKAEDGESPNALLYSADGAMKFIEEVLWDKYAVITEYALQMTERLEEFDQNFKGKPIQSSIEVAALFLDMETYKIALMRPSEKPRAKETIYRKLLADLRWEDRGEYIVMGADASLANPLLNGPEDFGILQGLVWELVIPLNLENLSDNSFRSTLEVADVLDFPGVERGGKDSPADKIDLDVMTEKKARREYLTERPGESDTHDPYQFFCKLLKRGKTSSIVCTYAQRMTIDIFNIFQDIDKDKPNGDELVTGVNTWWQSCAADYYRNQQGKSPLPLNYVLLWWADFFKARQDFTNISKKCEPVGEIANPEVSTTFAMNYYYIPGRGEMDERVRATVPEQIEFLRAEAVFKRQFLSNKVSEASFEAMIDDTKTGGAEYFFGSMRTQAEAVVSDPKNPRKETLARLGKEAIESISALLNINGLVPEDSKPDYRKATLLKIRETIQQAVEPSNDTELEEIECALRFLLNVDAAALSPLPSRYSQISTDYINDQLQQWVRGQTSRPLSSFPDIGVKGFERLDLLDGNARADFLQALVESVEPEIDGVARWIRDLVQYQGMLDEGNDLRRFLAVALSNLFTRIRSDDPFNIPDEEPEAMDALLDVEEEQDDWKLRGRDLPRYHVFLKGLIESDGVLEQLALRELSPVSRKPQPGDTELVELLQN